MNIKNVIITAYRALKRNSLRSVLTSIGIIIGISSVIVMVGLGNSARVTVQEMVHTFGINAMSIELMGGKAFTSLDIELIKKYFPVIEHISPVQYIPESDNSSILRYRQLIHRSQVYLTNEDFFKIKQRNILRGRFFTHDEVFSSAKVAVIGLTVKDRLFAGRNVLGKTILVGDMPVQVVGLLEESGQSFSGKDFDNVVIVPYTTGLKRLYNRTDFREMYAATKYPEDMGKARDQIMNYYYQKFATPNQEKEVLRVYTSEDKLKVARDISRALSILLAGIASISLFVGGVGIMNIMLVSVTERTREIGIRMAIGAKQSDIMLQFLVESTLLSTMGGIVGVIIGFSLYVAIAKIVGWPLIFSPLSVVISVAFASGVGIFFGYYPSQKASELKPIDALKYE